ncbi:hypothetical protein EVAR_86771_1 [Eumeta japonica]|uniref:Uncharacterized protein n=1 Tax=Eumeta variegata TaxID=151549 RepID=A0A4C1W354_EUMVA|nr:hypothetical protein EVAR_86771_1 [Eumeta japonica]
MALDYIKAIKIYDNSISRVKLETTGPPIQIRKGKESRKVGLEINLNKAYQPSFENTSSTYVDAYIYLGKQVLFNQQNNELKIERRVNITWKKFWNLKEILKSDMTIGMKTRVMNACYSHSTIWLLNLEIYQETIERPLLDVALLIAYGLGPLATVAYDLD